MSYLYLDTSHTLCCGILDQDCNWQEYVATDIVRSSGQVHGLLDQLLKKNNQQWSELAGMIISSGPGSYTGMRVSEGIAQILELDNLPIYSFYHFEVLHALGIEGIWISEAFKGEYFCYDSTTQQSRLLSLEEVIVLSNEHDILYALEEQVRGVDIKFYSTLALLRKQQDFFQNLINSQQRRSPFYYRPEDVEFTLKPKKQD